MKAVILAGGRGTRLAEETGRIPKPMVTIGGKPIIHHLMDYYSSWGVTDFVICAGYKIEVIRSYFDDWCQGRWDDVTFHLGDRRVTRHLREESSWNVTVVDTGLATQTAGRLRRVQEHLRNEERFFFTYGDGLANIDLNAELEQHARSGLAVTMAAVRPPSRFGSILHDNGRVLDFQEKPEESGRRINGGFYVIEGSVLSELTGDAEVWETHTVPRLVKESRVGCFEHAGFWHPIDTIHDRQEMERIWVEGAPWLRPQSLTPLPGIAASDALDSGAVKKTCRACGAALQTTVIDLGIMPATNHYLSAEALCERESMERLNVMVCETCWLAQTTQTPSRESIFTNDYAYFSSVSSSWVEHARRYVDHIVERQGLSESSFVVEIAANDGYLLSNFVERGIPCLGVEPTASTARVARSRGVPVAPCFFGTQTAAAVRTLYGPADLIVANNVLAHVPDIVDFATGVRNLLGKSGLVSFEFPHLLRLMEQCQFDTIYHEHFSYLSLTAASKILAGCGLTAVDVEELSTHGGSLRLYAMRSEATAGSSSTVAAVLQAEVVHGLLSRTSYLGFADRAQRIADDFRDYLVAAKEQGLKVVGYGAAAKGTTLLNYAGVGSDLLPVVVDSAPSKQGLYLPGCRIPILSPDALEDLHPDRIVVLPWNIADEIVEGLRGKVPSSTKFVTAIPHLREHA